MSMQKINPKMTVEEAKKILESGEYVPGEMVEIPMDADELFAKTTAAVEDPERDMSGSKYLQAAVLMRASIETLEQQLVDVGRDGPDKMRFCSKDPFRVYFSRNDYFRNLDDARVSTRRLINRHLRMMHFRLQFEEFSSQVEKLGGWMSFEGNAVKVCLPRAKFNEDQRWYRTIYYAYTDLGLANLIVDLMKEEVATKDTASSNEQELKRMRSLGAKGESEFSMATGNFGAKT